MQWRKSATWPMASVSRPSSNTCRNRSQIAGCAFSNSSSSTTENGCLRTRLMSEFDVAPPPRILCVGLRRLELAHVEADHAVDRAEQDIRRRVLASSVLPVPVGAREQEHADRLAGIVQAGLEHGDAVDDGADRLVLADDAAREVGADRGEVDALVAVEDRDGQAGELRQRHDHLVRLDLPLVALEDAGGGQLDEVEHRAREARRRSDTGAPS